VGRGFVTENEVSVMTGAGIMIFRRDELLAVVPGEQREWDRWHVDASLGVTLRGGNTKQNDLLTQATITRRGPFSRLTLSHRANFGTSDDSETINNQLGNVRVDLFVWDRVFITPFQIEFFRDTFQNIEYRVSPGAGVGYELIEKKWLEWNLEFGAVYRRTQFVSVEFPSSSVDDTFAFSFGTNFDWDITRRLELSGTYSASVAIPKASDTNQHAKAVLSFELTSILDLDVTLIWDRTGDPTPEADGTLPEPDDYVLSVGLAIDF
jgi:hypothetical protein